MDAARSRGRGGLFGCLRPFVVDDDQPVSDSASFLSSGDEGATKRKRRLRRSFSAALKAVIFRTALLKKSRSETRYEQDGCLSNFPSFRKSFVKSDRKNVSSKPLLLPEGIFWSNSSNHSPIFSSNSSSRTPSLSSLSASSRSTPSRSEPDNIPRSLSIDHFGQLNPAASKQKAMRRESGRKCAYVIPALEICVLLVCLAALIWGKAFAIVACTSAWLFFAPSGGRSRRRVRRVDSYGVGGDSEECKKRVIWKGCWKETGLGFSSIELNFFWWGERTED